MIRVQTERQFNSYAEAPAEASRAFQLRRSMWRADSQITNSTSVINSFDTAYSAIEKICDADYENDKGGINSIASDLRALSDSTASARAPLGQDILSQIESVVQAMNTRYGDNFVFAGADGLKVPFSWGEGEDGKKTLLYRGVDVNAPEGSLAKAELDKMAGEKTYVDIGLGFEEMEDGEMMSSSAFNSALSGLSFLGYGQDEDGDPKNLVLLMQELGDIFSRCDPEDGSYPPDVSEERASELTNKVLDAIGRMTEEHVKLSADTKYLKANKNQLTATKELMDTQREGIEGIDPALAITEMIYAQYSYNASLKIGNNILSQSLLDYFN